MVKASGGGGGVGAGDGLEVGVGVWVGVGVVADVPDWQPVTTTIKDRRQMPTVHIVTFRMMIYLLSIRVYFVIPVSLFV